MVPIHGQSVAEDLLEEYLAFYRRSRACRVPFAVCSVCPLLCVQCAPCCAFSVPLAVCSVCPLLCVHRASCRVFSVKDASGIARWEAPNVDACKSQSESDTTKRLKELNNTRITPCEFFFPWLCGAHCTRSNLIKFIQSGFTEWRERGGGEKERDFLI